MRTENVSKVTLSVQNSLGIIMCKFRAVQSKTEGMAASVRVFFEHPSLFNRNSWNQTLDVHRGYTLIT